MRTSFNSTFEVGEIDDAIAVEIGERREQRKIIKNDVFG